MDTPSADLALLPTIERLQPSQLVRRCAPEALDFETTAEIAGPDDTVWQRRAADAFNFAIGIDDGGYNVFAMGSEGVGRRTLARRFLERAAGTRSPPSDWCYVFNFREPHKPRAMAFPAGRGRAFKRDMERLVEELTAGLVAAFEQDDYRKRRQEIESDLARRQEQLVEGIGARAKAQNIGLLRAAAGFAFAPLDGEDVMQPEKFQALPEEDRTRIEAAIAGLQEELERAIQTMPKWRREAQRALRELERQVTRTTVHDLVEDLGEAYAAEPEVREYLAEVEADVVDHASWFQASKDGEVEGAMRFVLVRGEIEQPLRRYAVNLLVDHADSRGAPIVHEDNPTHDNLVGHVDHLSRMGALVTDFSLIKPGALHRANGGYLIVDALRLLVQPLAWEALKRALVARQIRTESLGQALGLVSTQSLEPEPIPLDIRIVLVGQRDLYYRLHELDPEFAPLFKVVADFRDDAERSAANERAFARLVASVVRERGLRPLDRAAVARVVECASRATGSADRLSLRMTKLIALLEEASYRAGAKASDVVSKEHVAEAIDAQRARVDRVPVELRDEMLRGRLLVATAGERIGQVNGIATGELGGFRFGIPVRITARARLGGGGLVDIERESELGGPLHSKGVMIVAGYLAAHYAPTQPLALSATLVFEQTYGPVEGDSASLAEVCALLSALADAPLSNAIAVTGSVDQHGDVQAVGAVNEKVEGFFDLCRQRGLSGRQGVIVPATNASQLMLRDDIVEAVAAGTFAVHAVRDVDAALEILTGRRAGLRDPVGRFPDGTLNAAIEARLAAFAERARTYAVPAMRPQRRRDSA